jgi:hypothetical protein
MITQPSCVKQYSSAKQRFFKPIIAAFFHNEFPKLFGPLMRDKIADELIVLFERNSRDITTLKPGQILWNALDKNTRGDSPNRRFVSVVLSLVTSDDISDLTKGSKPSVVAKNAIARMINEAYQQGGILSTRDIALLTLRNTANTSHLRSSYEKEHDVILPHTGALHDMGSTVTHKAAIVHKVIVEKKDPAMVARECRHSQRAVDHYLKDFYRVNSLYKHNQDLTFIHLVTGIAKHVVIQYINIIQKQNVQLSNI